MTRPSAHPRTTDRPLRLIAAGAVALAVGLAAGPAPAQSARDIAIAKQAFKEGDEAEARGDLPTALDRFQRAIAIKETPQLHLRVGGVQEKLGKLVAALASYEAGLAKAAGLPAVAKVAGDQIAALRPRIPTLTVVAAQPPADLTVTVDGAQIRVPLGSPLRLDPGAHRVHAEAAGFLPFDRTLTLVERDAPRVEIALALVAGPTGPPASDASSSSKLPGALVVGGAGAVLVAGVALFALSYVKDGQIDAECGGPMRLACPKSKEAQILGEVSTVNDLRFVGAGIGLLGAGGVAFGGYLLAKASRAAPSAAVRVFPLAGPGVAGVGAAGRF